MKRRGEDMNVVELENVTKRFEEIAAVDDVSFEVRSGQIVSLLGPSGCGKTTTLRLIAGFEAPDGGVVRISGNDQGGKRPYERNVGLLFQDYALFPHMTVADNVTYGMRHRGMDKASIPRRLAEMLELVQLTDFEKRRPAQLSGGEQQRVALARALATDPEVMLLDEPLSALDAKLRQKLRVELKQILSRVNTTTIVVTHDQEEAMSLAEHVLVMDHGRIEQQGSPTEIYAKPSNKFVAEFIGRSNWFEGELGAEAAPGIRNLITASGLSMLVPSDGSLSQVEVCVRPERLIVVRGESQGAPPSSDAVNVIRGTVVDVAYLGADVHLFVEVEGGQRLAAIEKNLGQGLERIGEVVSLAFGVEDCIVVPAGQ